jgi:hypothetical protein
MAEMIVKTVRAMRHKQTARDLKKQQVLLALMLFAALTVTGRSQTGAAANDLAQVFQIDLPSADTAILMDASLSMRNHRYPDVRQAVIEFASTLMGKETLNCACSATRQVPRSKARLTSLPAMLLIICRPNRCFTILTWGRRFRKLWSSLSATAREACRYCFC